MSVSEALARLRAAPRHERGALAAEFIGGGPHRIALDDDARPIVLLQEVAPRGRPRRIELPFVWIATRQHAQAVSATGERFEVRAAVVGCRSDDPAAQAYFVAVVEALVERLGQGGATVLEDELEIIRELFAATGRAPTRTAVGLWAELFLLNSADEPAWLAEAWRSRAEDRYDFGGVDWRIEVKGYGGRAREHHVSHRQSWPPQGLDVIFASMPVEAAEGGATVHDLVERIAAKLASRPDLVLKVRSVVASTLGRDVFDRGPAFDSLVAAQGLRFYRADGVPRLPYDLPEGVLDARVLIDFEDAEVHSRTLEDLDLW